MLEMLKYIAWFTALSLAYTAVSDDPLTLKYLPQIAFVCDYYPCGKYSYCI